MQLPKEVEKAMEIARDAIMIFKCCETANMLSFMRDKPAVMVALKRLEAELQRIQETNTDENE